MGIVLKVNFENIQEMDYKSNEAYKTLRTNITFCGKNIKKIIITSTVSGEGKSVVAFNLAKSLAETGKKVIFIDADLRKSVLLRRFHIDRAVRGFSHYLTGLYKKEDVIYESNLNNLHMIFAGPVPPNPVELLENKYSLELMNNLKEEYDYVIFDTPPLGSVIDSAILAAKCDGAIVVIEANSNNYKRIVRVIEQLEKTGCKILGAVLNKVNVNSKEYYGNYSSYEKRYSNN